jgi:hypothetical protein
MINGARRIDPRRAYASGVGRMIDVRVSLLRNALEVWLSIKRLISSNPSVIIRHQ